MYGKKYSARKTDRQAGKQAGRRAGRQADRQTDRQTGAQVVNSWNVTSRQQHGVTSGQYRQADRGTGLECNVPSSAWCHLRTIETDIREDRLLVLGV